MNGLALGEEVRMSLARCLGGWKPLKGAGVVGSCVGQSNFHAEINKSMN